MIKFFVPGEPVGKGRPRFTTINGHVKAYTPTSTQTHERSFRRAYDAACNSEPKKGPVRVEVTAVFQIPKSFSKAKREMAYAGKLRPTKKPDLDNIVKLAMDAINGKAYTDDANVVAIVSAKRFVMAENESPGTYVTVEEVAT